VFFVERNTRIGRFGDGIQSLPESHVLDIEGDRCFVSYLAAILNGIVGLLGQFGKRFAKRDFLLLKGEQFGSQFLGDVGRSLLTLSIRLSLASGDGKERNQRGEGQINASPHDRFSVVTWTAVSGKSLYHTVIDARANKKARPFPIGLFEKPR